MDGDDNRQEEITARVDHFAKCLITLCFLFATNPKDIQVKGRPGLLLTQLRPHDDMIFRLRESILFRADCISFHCRILSQIDSAYRNEFCDPNVVFNHEGGISEISDDLLRRSAMQQTFLFDDVTFHLMSMFEYIGCLVGYLFEGPQGANLKWGRAYKMLAEESPVRNEKTNRRKKVNSTFRDSKAAASIRKHEKEFVKWLEEYRASVFHYRSVHPGGKSSFNIMDVSKNEIKVTATSEMKKWIGRIIPEIGEKDMMTTEVAYKLVVDGIERATDVVLMLQRDVREMNEKKMPFWFQGS